MACCHTTMLRWSVGSSCSSTCGAQQGGMDRDGAVSLAQQKPVGWQSPGAPIPALPPHPVVPSPVAGMAVPVTEPQAGQETCKCHWVQAPAPATPPRWLWSISKDGDPEHCPLPLPQLGWPSPHLDGLHLLQQAEVKHVPCCGAHAGGAADGADGGQKLELLILFLPAREGTDGQTATGG